MRMSGAGPETKRRLKKVNDDKESVTVMLHGVKKRIGTRAAASSTHKAGMEQARAVVFRSLENTIQQGESQSAENEQAQVGAWFVEWGHERSGGARRVRYSRRRGRVRVLQLHWQNRKDSRSHAILGVGGIVTGRAF
jgi:hypothetical protein